MTNIIHCEKTNRLICIKYGMKNKLFYTELGRLLYAVANADENINEVEKETITKMILERLLQHEKENDQFGSNAAWQTQFAFDTAEEGILDPKVVLDEFLAYSDANKKDLSDEELQLGISLAEHLAEAYRHKNKKENKMLTTLRSHLWNIHRSQLIF